MLDDISISELRDDLIAAGYTYSAVAERLGETALAALGRNTTAAVEQLLAGATDAQADAIRLWLLQQSVPAQRLRGWRSLPALRAAGLLVDPDRPRATVELKPHASDRREGWICSDQTPLDGQLPPPRPDFVLGASPAATTLSQLIPPGAYRQVLDLGTGCGIQALHLDAEQIVATDLNPRAVQLARISLGLSGVSADLRLGDLYAPVAGERFDLIATNPPYVIGPPARAQLTYREAGLAGDELMRRVVTEGAAQLAEGGLLVVLGNWAVTAEQPWTDRLADWLRPTGCDALVLCRELLDPYEYIEIWLADAGVLGSDDYRQRYAEWLDYFQRSGIEAVGMGWLVLRRSGRAQPELRLEEWPHAVQQPVGQAFADFFAAIEPSRLADADFLATRWRMHPQLSQETLGRPGAADPEHVVLRQQYGFGRAIEAGTAVAAIVGACDGDLPVGELIDAVAGLLAVDAAALRSEVLPVLRSLVGDGYLLIG